MNYANPAPVILDKPPSSVMAWFEWPLLFYFMIHFFPPVRGAIGPLCLVFGTLGVLWECRRFGCPQYRSLNTPIVWCWVALAGLLGLSLFQVPTNLLAESLHRFSSDVLKGSFFALILLLYLNSAERARRLLIAGMLACVGMLLHVAIDTAYLVTTTGQLPFQRDYLFWLPTFFPFALAVYVSQPKWRWLALFAAAGVLALAVLTGFRGALLALLLMLLIFAVFVRLWRLLVAGAVLAAAGVFSLLVWFPAQADYVLGKFQQIDSSNRVTGHWLPAWDLSLQAPWVGHGFGHWVFRYYYGLGIPSHPAWTPAWSEQLGWLPSAPHSIVFETLFAAGWPGLLALILLSLVFLTTIGMPLWQLRAELVNNAWLLLALAVLVSFVGNYLVLSQLESPSWRTLPILAAIAAACICALKADPARAKSAP